jgi:hypothetical protein
MLGALCTSRAYLGACNVGGSNLMTCIPYAGCVANSRRVAATCNQQQDCWYQQNSPSAVPQHVLASTLVHLQVPWCMHSLAHRGGLVLFIHVLSSLIT